MDSKSQLVDGNTTNNSDQRITDFPLEEIMKEYLWKEDFQSFYADAFDIEPLGLGLTDLVPDDVNVSEVNTDFLVPDSLFLDEICQKHDNTEPEEQLYSLLEEYIKEEEDKREGNRILEMQRDSGNCEVSCSPASSASCQTNVTRHGHAETAEPREPKKPRQRLSKRSQRLKTEEQPQTISRKRRKKKC